MAHDRVNNPLVPATIKGSAINITYDRPVNSVKKHHGTYVCQSLDTGKFRLCITFGAKTGRQSVVVIGCITLSDIWSID